MSYCSSTRASMRELMIAKAQGGKDMSSGGFAARAQSAGQNNANANAQQGTKGQDTSSKK